MSTEIESDNKTTVEKVDKTQAYNGVFANASSQEEVDLLRAIVEKYCPWPLVYENGDGTYQVGGLSRSGGRLDQEETNKILNEINLFRNKEETPKEDLA